MRRIRLLALVAAVTMLFISCNNETEDTTTVSGKGASTTVPTLEAASTYTSTGHTWYGNNVTLAISVGSATDGIFQPNSRENFHFTGIDSTTGELSGDNIGNIGYSTYILKSGDNIYVVGQVIPETRDSLFGDWTVDGNTMTFNSDGKLTHGSETGFFTNKNGYIVLTEGGIQKYMFFANNKLYARVARITKQ